MTERIVNVMVVDDSSVARMHLTGILESDPGVRVLAALSDGQAALGFIKENKPDVVLMDVHMPGMDGFEVTRCIMETQPVPIIICTSTMNATDVATTFRAMEAGAVACLEKPAGREHEEFERMSAALLQTVKLMSEVKVVRRWSRARNATVRAASTANAQLNQAPGKIGFVGIGTSTGGPPVLNTILSGLSKDFPAPIMIVQHIAPGFLSGLAEWLNQSTGLEIHIAAPGASPIPGHVYLAPDGFHMGLSSGGIIRLSKEEPRNGLRPSVSYLFQSLAEAYGPRAVGVLLTGMGKDGAAELKLMRDNGAITIAQDRESSIVHGMPGEAILLDGATHVLGADKIAGMLLALTGHTNGKERDS